ncbi:MAG: hypothetical protein AAGA20_04170 [Planctomycetota bacterium]
MKQSRRKLFVAIAVLVAGFAAAEVGARALSRVDDDGNVFVRSTRLRPYRAPVERVRALVDDYLARPDTALAYHSGLGWAYRPGATSENGLDVINDQGLRTLDAREYAEEPPEGRFRISLFGDSFSAGADVPYEDSFAHQLEEIFRARGVDAEVVNFACGGWGMGQALLKWRESGARYSTDVVLFGFQAENAQRNLNMFRSLYYLGTGIPLAKPRLVLREDGSLDAVNVPTPEPLQVPEILASLETWDLLPYETFYDATDYERPWYASSRAVSFVVKTLSDRAERSPDRRAARYALESEAASLVLAIVDEFSEGASSAGADFAIVHLPTRKDLARLSAGKELLYGDLLRALGEAHRVIDPSQGFLDLIEEQGPAAVHVSERNGHYARAGHAVVAEALADAIAAPDQNR